ncbi:MAG: VOC family protein [Actinomycetes bacterium]
MTTRDEPWPAGTPAWVELTVPDRRRAMEFYGGLLGWSFEEGPPETGYYTQSFVDGRVVVGLSEPMPGQPPSPAAWLTYLAVDAVDTVVERVRDAGGAVLMEPMDVMDFGRMAIAADPTGAVFGLWQSGTHTGFGIANEPGSVTWNEVLTRDVDAAQAFYRAVFGYGFGDMSGEGFRYATLDIDGRPCGGVGSLAAGTPDEVPAHWQTYFMVDDADDASTRVTELGGRVTGGPQDSPYGRMVFAAGPFGEPFALMGPVPAAAQG